MKKIVSIFCIAAAFVFASKAIANDGTYGIHYNNTGPWVDGYWENPETGERSDAWKSGWTQVAGHNQLIGAWHLNSTGQAYNAVKDSSLSLGIERNNTASGFDYGTFLYDTGSGQIVANSETLIGSVGAGETGSGTSIAYTAGDYVGVWVEYDGVRYYSQDSLNAGHHTETFGNNAPYGYTELWFDDRTGWPGGQAGAPIKILVTGVAPASTGAPLPGVLATMVLCGGVGGYLRKRSKAAERVEQ